jgi:cation diffusion facilitator CzcD-associated flavoprotein CzcO
VRRFKPTTTNGFAASHVTPDAIVMEDGAVHPADVIIMATGFHASKMLWPMDISGRGGPGQEAAAVSSVDRLTVG